MKLCNIKGCGSKYYSMGYCSKHYRRWQRHGNPLMVLERSGGSTGGELHWNWRGGTSKYPRYNIMRKQRLILFMNNPKCEMCGKIATLIHHKDKNRANHKLANLMTVCVRCHMSFHKDELKKCKN